jgi:tetratricopeptide (TPR) repeat protein
VALPKDSSVKPLLTSIDSTANVSELRPSCPRRWFELIVWVLVFSSINLKCTFSVCAPQRSGEADALGACSQSAESPQFLDISNQPQQDAEKHYLGGLQLRISGDDAGAEKELRSAKLLNPTEDKYVRELTLFYVARGRYDEAIGVITDHVKLCGVTALGYELEAELLFQQKLYDPAHEAVLGSLKLSDRNSRMHELLGLIYIVKRQDAAAALELQKAIELNPNDAQARYYLGRVLYTTGNYPEARDQFLVCLKIQPGYRKALENLGLSYEALQDYPKATQAYLDAIASEKTQAGPKHAEPYAFYGAMLAKLDQPEKALTVLEEAVAVGPKSFVANYHLGRVLLNLNRIDEAEKYLVTAADLDPKFSRTYYLLGNIRRKQNRRDEAEKYWAKFQELDKVLENRVFPLTGR